MRAIVQDTYGDPRSVLEAREIDRPTPREDEVLVRAVAASLHRGDCFVVRGKPLLMRPVTGVLRPKVGIPGYDTAGVVEEVGAAVTDFAPGDEVFGSSEGAYGACAEYVCAKASHLCRKPANVTFEQAAAVPTSGLAALHGLRDAGRLQTGQRVLINGASGGVGSFAVQIAKALEAHATGVSSTKNVELVRAIGADEVIDYTVDDFAKGDRSYDLILDNVENRSLKELRRALSPGGTLILNSGTGATGLRLLVRLTKPMLLAPFVKERLVRYLSVPTAEDLAVLAGFLESGRVVPAIDRTYELEEVPEAMEHVCAGHARGKVVIRINS